MDKNAVLTTLTRSGSHYRNADALRSLSARDNAEGEALTFCDACSRAGLTRSAVGHTSHPEYRRLALCAGCIADYDRAEVE
jgi:hypothetical protein